MSDITEHVIIVKAQQSILPGSTTNDDVPPHAGNHQKGGSDELDLAGLIGELEDPQKAGYIFDAPIDLTGLADGYVLKYDLATDTWLPGPDLAGSLQGSYVGGSGIVTSATYGDITITGTEEFDVDVVAKFKNLWTDPVLAAGDKIVLLDSTLAFGMVLQDIAGDAQLLFTADIMGFQDANLAAPFVLAAPGTASFDTVAQELVDAVNEAATAGGGDAESIWAEDIEDRPLDVNALGPQLSTDPHCNDFTLWTAHNSATLSNTIAGIVRATYNGTNPFGAKFTIENAEDYIVLAKLRGDGTASVGLRVGGASVDWTGTNSANWQYAFLDITSNGTSLIAQGSGAGAGNYIEVDYLYFFKKRDIKNNHKRMDFQWLENLFTYSEDFSDADWVKTASTIDSNSGILSPIIDRDTGLPVEFMGLVATAASSQHHMNQTKTTTAEHYVFVVVAKKGAEDWLNLTETGGASNAYFDLLNGVQGAFTSGNYIDALMIDFGDGRYLCAMEFLGTAGSTGLRVQSAEADNDKSFTGDGVAISTLLQGAQIYKGTLKDNFPYVKTTTAAETGKHEYVHEVETLAEYRTRLGLLERVDDQGFATDIFETPVDDVEYLNGFKDGAQAYYQQHTVAIGSVAQTIINADFYTNGFELYSWRFFAVNDTTPTTKYAIPKDGINPSFTIPAVSTSNGLSITRSGTGVYPGWSYIGGYTYFK